MSGPTITVAVLGDNDQLSRTFKEVEQDAAHMADSVGKSSADLGSKVEDLDGKASSAERGFRGFSDSLNGTSDVMGGLQSGNLVQLGMGMADLFGAVQDLFLPLLQQMAAKLGLVTVATETQTTAQEASNVAMSANPIGLVVLALVALAAAFYVAWTKSETFRDIVTGAFEAVQNVVGAVVGFVQDHWGTMLAILTGGLSLAVQAIIGHWDTIRDTAVGVFHTINDVAGPILDAIRGGFDFVRDGVQFVIDKVNGLIGIIKGPFSAVTGAIGAVTGGVGGAFHKVFAAGGIVPGTPGQAVPIVAHAGEVILNAAQQSMLLRGGVAQGNTTVYYPTGYNQRAVSDAQRRWARLNPVP